MCSCRGCKYGTACIYALYKAPIQGGSYHNFQGWSQLGYVKDEAFEFPAKVPPKPEMEKHPGAYRLFRVWKMSDEGDLRAIVAEFTWSPGENASLTTGGDASHNSGFYGFNSLGELQKQENDWWEASQSGKGVQRFADYVTDSGWCTLCSTADCWHAKAPIDHFICGTTLNYGHLKVSDLGARSQFAVPEYIIRPDGSDLDFEMRVLNVAEKYDMKIITLSQARAVKTGLVPWWKGRPNR